MLVSITNLPRWSFYTSVCYKLNLTSKFSSSIVALIEQKWAKSSRLRVGIHYDTFNLVPILIQFPAWS